MWDKKVELLDFTGTDMVGRIAEAGRFSEEDHPLDKL